jgi:hypothetical protein
VKGFGCLVSGVYLPISFAKCSIDYSRRECYDKYSYFGILPLASNTMRITAFVFTVVASFAPQSVSSYAFQGPSRLARSRSSLSMSIEEVPLKENIRVGVIGMGRIGVVHLEAISKAPGVTAVIVSNPTVSKAEAGTNNVMEYKQRERKILILYRYCIY